MHLLKVPVARRWCYTISLEQIAGYGTFVHCDIHTKWTKLVKEMVKSGWHLVKTAHGGPLYAEHDPEDTKHTKFLKMFGFEMHTTTTDGKEIWRYNNG
jgi:hypothetical protein